MMDAEKMARDGAGGIVIRFGIRAKLLVAVGTVAVMTVLAGGLTWDSYSQMEHLLAAVTRGNLPHVSNALKLSEAAARLAAAAPALDASATQFQRQSNFIALQQQTERLLTLIDGLGGSDVARVQLDELRALAASIGQNVITRNALVDQRLRLAEDMHGHGERIERLNQEFLALMEAGRSSASLARLHYLLDRVRAAAIVDDAEALNQLRRQFDESARLLAAEIDALPPGPSALRDLARKALGLGSGAGNVFEQRGRLLSCLGQLERANGEGRELVARTSTAVGRQVFAAEEDAAANDAAAEAALTDGRRTLLVVALFTFFGPLLFVWLYLGRNLVGRLTGVAGAMHRIADGDFQTVIPRSGQDEIAEMADELAVFRDAMARLRETSQAQMESEHRLRTILATSPLALGISRLKDNRLIYVNPRWSEIYLVDEAAASGRDAGSFYADGADLRRVVELAQSEGYVANYECRMVAADGREFWAMLSAALIDMDGGPAVIVSSSDITLRKEEEAALAEAKREAEDASQAKSLFLATMSHEIRTPMNGVLTMAHLLEESRLPPEQREMARVIRDSATSLLTIINDILDFSKIESGKLQLETLELSLLEVVEGVSELLAPKAAEKGIGLITFVDPALPEIVRGDPVRLRQILINLAGNAVKFTDRGYVRIAAEPGEERDGRLEVRFSVTDTGIGLDEDSQARLFEPFAQADLSISRRYGGTGLGLSICRRLVAMMDGTIGVDSRTGEGASFWFSVPLDTGGVLPVQGPDLAGVAVLVLAEGPVAAECLRQYLGHQGAQVAMVASSDGALAAVRAAALAGWCYDVVLMDGGADLRLRIAVARALAVAAGEDTAMRVVMMVPHVNYSLAMLETREAGLFATLAKPVRRGALWRTVAAAAGRGFIEEEEEERAGFDDTFVAPSVEEAAAAGALILVAEDNPTNQVVIRRLMDRLGYAIDLVANGLEAWERMQIRDYGLLLTDCHMPEMDGYELTERLRGWEKQSLHHLPVVALTADALAGTAKRCHECGMDAFLAKPIDLAQLDATLRRLLPRAVALRRRRGSSVDAAPADWSASRDAPPRDDAPPVLDLTPMRQIFGTLNDDARQLLDLFVESTRPLVDQVCQQLEDGNLEAAREAAHSAKGAGNSAGAYRFARLCAELENLACQGDLEVARTMAVPLRQAFTDVAQVIMGI